MSHEWAQPHPSCRSRWQQLFRRLSAQCCMPFVLTSSWHCFCSAAAALQVAELGGTVSAEVMANVNWLVAARGNWAAAANGPLQAGTEHAA